MNTTIPVQLPADAMQRLHELAAQSGRSSEEHITNAVLEYLEDMEDLRVAEERWCDIESGKSDTVPLEEVMKRYGMEV